MPLAQLVEHLTFNQMVVGSIPTRHTILAQRACSGFPLQALSFRSLSSSLAQDTALSRRRRGFESPWGRQKEKALPLFMWRGFSYLLKSGFEAKRALTQCQKSGHWSGPRKRAEGSLRRSLRAADDVVGESPWGRQIKSALQIYSVGRFIVDVWGHLDGCCLIGNKFGNGLSSMSVCQA